MLGGATGARPIPKKMKIKHISGSTVKFYTVCFYCMSKSRSAKYIKIKVLTLCFDLI